MESRQCAACGLEFRPRPQVPQQCYCSATACQRERQRRWQIDKRRDDHDYQDNQARAQRAWCERNPDYWRDYRADHPEYIERNRAQQRDRNARRRETLIAKNDASPPVFPLRSGIYQISPAPPSGIVKMDAWTVEITLISTPYDQAAERCKETTP
jgi:hypothetical protein